MCWPRMGTSQQQAGLLVGGCVCVCVKLLGMQSNVGSVEPGLLVATRWAAGHRPEEVKPGSSG